MVDFRTHVDRILKKSTEVFGEAVTLYPTSGGVYKLRGVFNNEYQIVDPDTEQVISANQPALGINLNDFKGTIKTDDIVVIRDFKFKIVDKREDGQGGAVLLLHKVKHGQQFPDTKAPKT